MAESATSSDPLCTNAGAIKLKVDREASLFEHPGIVENVIAYLAMWEVLSLGSCSKYLNGVCESDCTWKLLYKRRWGRQAIGKSSEDAQTLTVNRKEWKLSYIARQKDWFAMISEAKDLKKAMAARGVIDKVVSVRWTILRTCSFGFYMPEENHMRVYSLGVVAENQMSILWLMKQSYENSYTGQVSRVTLSYKIPEPLNCITQPQK